MSKDQGQVTGQVQATVPGPGDTTRTLVSVQAANAARAGEPARPGTGPGLLVIGPCDRAEPEPETEI